MPPVEAGEVQVVLLWDDGGVERLVVWVPQLDVLQPFILFYEAVSNDLDLRLVRDRLEVWMQDGSFRVERLAVTVRGRRLGIEPLRNLVLRPGGCVMLCLEDEDLVLV